MSHPDTPRPAKRRASKHVPRLVRHHPRQLLTARRPIHAVASPGEPTFADRLLVTVKELESPPAPARVDGNLTPTVHAAETCARAQVEKLSQYLRLESSWLHKAPRFSDYSDVWYIYEQLAVDCRIRNVPRDWGALGAYSKAFSFTDFITINRSVYDDGSEEFTRWEREIKEVVGRVYLDMAESLRKLGYRVVALRDPDTLMVMLPDQLPSVAQRHVQQASRQSSTEPDDD